MLESQTAQLLLDIFNNIDVFVFAFVRILGFMVIMPFFAGQTIPTITKIGFSLSLAMIAMLNGNLTVPYYQDSFFGLFAVVLNEVLAGLIMGFVVYIMFAIFYYAGQLMDYQIGFSMVSVYDPLSQIQAPVTGNFYYLVYISVLVTSGGLHNIIYNVFNSYGPIPIGGAFILGNDGLTGYLSGMITGYFELGFKIAMPIIGTIIVVDVALGILVKAVPQMNVFVVGMPMKLLIGLGVLYVTAPYIGNTFEEFFSVLSRHLGNVIKGMSP